VQTHLLFADYAVSRPESRIGPADRLKYTHRSSFPTRSDIALIRHRKLASLYTLFLVRKAASTAHLSLEEFPP
jgi:hypothetical protein